MPGFHSEPYIYLAGLSHKSALIAWGAFYFKLKDSGAIEKLVDDDDLDFVHPPGTRPSALNPSPTDLHVQRSACRRPIVATSFTETVNHCWVTGLEPDTGLRDSITVKGDEWAKDERWVWDRATEGACGSSATAIATHFAPFRIRWLPFRVRSRSPCWATSGAA